MNMMNKKHGKNNMYDFQRNMKRGFHMGGQFFAPMGDEYGEGGFDLKGMKGISPYDRFKESLKQMSPPFPDGNYVNRNRRRLRREDSLIIYNYSHILGR